MNFLCEKCKQKYHVADEKLAGRAVTRFRCKKCDNVIELHAPTSQPAPAEAAPSHSPVVQRPATQAVPVARSARPRPATSVGPAYGAVPARQATMPPTSTARAPSATASTSDHGWYAGIRDVPVGPLSRKDLGARVAAGDVTPDTLVWREGLDDWRPLQAVAELNDLMRATSGVVESRPPSRATPNSAASRSAAPRPSIDDDDEEATRVSGLDPSLAGIMSRSNRPLEPSAPKPAEKPASPGLSPLARSSAAGRGLTPAAPLAAQGSKPVERTPEKPIDKPAIASSEPAAERSAVFPPPARPAVESASRSAPPIAHDEIDPPSGPAVIARSERIPVVAPFAPSSGAVEKAPTTPASKPPTLDDFNSSLPDDLFASSPAIASSRPANASATLSANPLASTPPSDVLMPPSVATPDLAPPPVPAIVSAPPPAKKPAKQGSLPAAAWVFMAGVLVAGIGGGIYIGRMNQPDLSPVPPQPLRTPRAAVLADAAAHPTPAVVDASALASDASGPSPRSIEVAQAFRDSRVVDTCWQSTLQQNANLHDVTVAIEVGVDATGHFTRVAVADTPDPRFETCLRAHLAEVPAVSAGAAAEARTSVALSVRH